MSQPAEHLWQLSATELAAAYRAGTTTPAAVVEALLARIAEVNPRLNAIITLDAEGARTTAQASSRRWRAGRPLSPLDGIPVSVKDNIPVRGLRATWGSRLYADHVPAADETPVARLRAAGAVILGKTNVPEFTLIGYTDNALFGPTRNPWRTDLTPGGSSGGAVAAVAAGLGPLALGTDGGGSIRRPAAHTGLVGFKPSRGMVERAHGFPAILHDLEVAGPIARTVGDIAAAMDVIAAPTWHAAADDRFPSRLRIVFAPTFADAPVDPAIADAVAEVAAGLARQGHDVEIERPFDLAQPVADAFAVIGQAGLAWLLSQHGDVDDRIGAHLAEMARAGRRLAASDYVAALDIISTVTRDFAVLFERADLLLTPTTSAMPWAAEETHPTAIAGKPVGPRGHAVFTPFVNAVGLPAISLPCPTWDQGLPIGFQLCAAHGRDRALVEVASRYEASAHWRSRWPAL